MEIIKGYIENIIFRSEDTGYCVLELMEDNELVTCVGTLPGIDVGVVIEASGEYVSHSIYGDQFKVKGYKEIMPEDAISTKRYLSSGAIKGIGTKLADRILDRYGDDTFRIIEEEPERLAEVKGISESKARDIAIQVMQKKDLRDAILFLQQYNITISMANKIYSKYGANLYGIMRENPYKLAEDISGISFKIADSIAIKSGIMVNSQFRIKSGLLYILSIAQMAGHMYLPLGEALSRTSQLLEVDASEIEDIIDSMIIEHKIVRLANNDNIQLYYAPLYYMELNCANMMLRINEGYENIDYANIDFKELNIYKNEGKNVDELQLEAIEKSLEYGVLILTGGPGTGKTTTINAIIEVYDRLGMNILLAAPTGRAAKRMTEATGMGAKTIHRLLEVNGGIDSNSGAVFERNEENPLDADVIILDEMSMVDAPLFYALLKAIPIGARLILVGDMHQLPSVGPGQVLRDIINSNIFTTVKLKNIFRQAMESDIITNAHKIRSGEKIKLDNNSKDFFLLERDDNDSIYRVILGLLSDKIPRYVDASWRDIQVMTPMRKGNMGVNRLNTILQKHMNIESDDKPQIEIGDRIFRLGDKVMQIKNNYQMEWEILGKYGIVIESGTGIFNGDVGSVIDIDTHLRIVTVVFEESRRVRYTVNELEELELAYAITIHKSQGSEYPAIIVPLLNGPEQLYNRNLLYTAVTRAKKCVIIVGSSLTVERMIDNVIESKRYSGLRERIEELSIIHENS